MTQEQISELLKPRYRVIADYPGHSHGIGKIIELDDPANRVVIEQQHFYNKYPHLFRKLEWWEYRKQEEMPEYVKRADGTVCKIHSWAKSDFFGGIWYDETDTKLWSNHCAPATESDYNEYLQTVTPNQEP